MKEVSLFPAYGWTCDDCGRDNIAVQMIVEQRHPATDGHGNVVEDGPVAVMHLVYCPQKTVKCKFCESVFEVEQAKDIEN